MGRVAEETGSHDSTMKSQSAAVGGTMFHKKDTLKSQLPQPSTCEDGLVWKQGLRKHSQVKMKSY